MILLVKYNITSKAEWFVSSLDSDECEEKCVYFRNAVNELDKVTYESASTRNMMLNLCFDQMSAARHNSSFFVVVTHEFSKNDFVLFHRIIATCIIFVIYRCWKTTCDYN